MAYTTHVPEARAVQGIKALDPERTTLTGYRGSVEAAVGDTFTLAMPSDGTWRIVEFTSERTYSPSGFGGTPSVWCRLVEGDPQRWAAYRRADGCVELCGDSIASALIAGGGAKPSTLAPDEVQRIPTKAEQ